MHWKHLPTPPDGWRSAAREIASVRFNRDKFQKLLTVDPDFVEKYIFIQASAITENPSLPQEFKLELVRDIIYGNINSEVK